MTTTRRFTTQQRARRRVIADASAGFPTPAPLYPPPLPTIPQKPVETRTP
ncbi:hypothetical protein ACFWF9_02645 [Streptomyces roseolus]